MKQHHTAHVPAVGEPDHFLARLIHVTLVGGLVISVSAMAVGLILGAAGGPAAAVIATWLMQAGLLALLATPALRVVIAIVGYVIEHDWLFTAISAIVLVLLAISYFAGHV